ncbi:N-acetylmuramoyl-L-alanine amidase [Pontibacillus yanchengensis]|uniref:N-acetylmuramoyl-L-alanine amidase n=1 Tax=Pontibacillus yanchengensis TaxID=462910 RepID=A0A6I5A421_9BACI|nr:N-acetylmuramoyl-L-alanine amidase [Pontibacillus yanchengensis]MYL34369.1 N-acetylmuramoyl-L-alanine amidase [Pontibacillus yanchengensis]
MTKRVAWDNGHGFNTSGKRSPDGEREWSFNDEVGTAGIHRLRQYEGVEVVRLDDSTGKRDLPLTERTNKANQWKADILVSCHHNAYQGKWGNHTGIETYTYVGHWPEAERLANHVHKRVIDVYGLADRGHKKADFHMLRESFMPAILCELGFMDSTIDIRKLRNKTLLHQAGEAIADGIADYLGLKLRNSDFFMIEMERMTPTKREEVESWLHERGWVYSIKNG